MSVNIAMSPGVLFGGEQNVGPAFPLVKALKSVNAKLRESHPDSDELFKVIVFTGESDSVEETIRGHELEELVQAVRKGNLLDDIMEHNIHLYLSESKPDVLQVLQSPDTKTAAAVINDPGTRKEVSEDQLRLAFDGDAVLFSNESEKVFQVAGLQGYLENEKNKVEQTMTAGPFKGFLQALVRLKMKLPDNIYRGCPIRTYLVTSRDAGYAGYRALNTLRSWALEIDEAVFLRGTSKGPTLERIRPHIFFDDQEGHVTAALRVGTVAGLVPYS